MNPVLRIESFSIHCYALPYVRPVHWFDSVEAEGLYVMLRLNSVDGHTGISEAPIRPTWAGVSLRSLIAVLEDLLLPAVQAVDLTDVQAVRDALDRFPENQLAKMLVDNACWSLRASTVGQPLWQAWGGHSKIALSWCVTRQAPQLMAEEARDMVARFGFHALKVKGGQGQERDLEALRLIRGTVGAEVAIYVDANCAYSRDEALDYVKAIADAGAIVAEDPCQMAPDSQFAKLVAASPLPILVDTQCSSLRDARAFLERGATALSVKAGRIGFTEARRIAGITESEGASVAAGLYAESALGTLVSLQLAAALGHPLMPAELSFFLMLREQVLITPLEVHDGNVILPTSADFSQLIDWDRVRRFTVSSA